MYFEGSSEDLEKIRVALLNRQQVVKTLPYDRSALTTPVALSVRRLTDCSEGGTLRMSPCTAVSKCNSAYKHV